MIVNSGITEIATEIHQIQVFPSFLSFFLFISIPFYTLLLNYTNNALFGYSYSARRKNIALMC